MKKVLAFGLGRVQLGKCKKSLAVQYVSVNFDENLDLAQALLNGINCDDSELVLELDSSKINYALEVSQKDSKNSEILSIMSKLNDSKDNYKFVATFLFEDLAPKSVESVYLKLYLLSQQKAAIRSLNLNGSFALLPNLAWDSNGVAYELDYLRDNEVLLKLNAKYPNIVSVDKFPRYLSHIIPSDNTRILDSAKVRLGASLAGGTTVMPGASYVNFNSGTTGSVMVEGRISSCVIVGEGSDIGGGASILGVLSGTNGNPISVGKRCLLGANSVTGIPLGDDCIIDAGVAILEGTKIYISPKDRSELEKINEGFKFDKEIYKGMELSHLNGIHYRQNSQSGQITAGLSKRAIKLNDALH